MLQCSGFQFFLFWEPVDFPLFLANPTLCLRKLSYNLPTACRSLYSELFPKKEVVDFRSKVLTLSAETGEAIWAMVRKEIGTETPLLKDFTFNENNRIIILSKEDCLFGVREISLSLHYARIWSLDLHSLWCRYSSREKKPIPIKAELMIKRNCKLYKGVICYVYDNRNNKWK